MSNNSSSSGNSRNGYNFPDFSLRRLLLQTRAGRSPYSNRMCDVERGSGSSSSKTEKSSFGATSSSASHRNDSSAQYSGTGSSTSATSTTPSTHQYAGNQRGPASRSSGGILSFASGTSHSTTGCGGTNNNNNSRGSSTNSQQQECPLCYGTESQGFYTMLNCKHFACRSCLESYLTIEIFESRTEIACPQCTEAMHPSDIEILLRNFPTVMKKYEDFMVRRVLLSDPDSRWCPAPDCSYAVIATGCASCPRIKCERPGCDVNFCYHCKAEWHPDQTCDAARASRQSPMRAASGSISQDSQHRGDDIKPCPRCQVLIVKMDDGSCNHMVCAVCGSEFCWLCMKEISDLHYLSPSGCTFWGKKPWSRKKKLLWQLGTLVGAPVGIALVAGIAVPAMIIGIPVWIGRKLHTRYRLSGKHKRNCAVLGGVAASVLISPVLAGLAVAIGVPILLFYVYGVVPVSLCRAGCAVSTTRDGFKFDFDEEDNSSRNQDASSVDAISRIGATSIGEVSLSVASGSHIGVSSQNNAFMLAHSTARESTTALSGSITGNKMEVQADVSASETASAVTCVSEKSGNTLNDTASTRALAGSMYKQHMDSSNISEDGASERVRFDNTIFYVMDNKKDFLDKDTNSVDKASVGSERSFRLYNDDGDTASQSSIQKRSTFTQRMPTLNSSNNIAEVAEKEILNISDESTDNNPSTSIALSSSSSFYTETSAPTSKSALNSVPAVSELSNTSSHIKPNETMPAGSNIVSDTNLNSRTMSKAAVLRYLFFAQSNNSNNNNGNSTINSINNSNNVTMGTNLPSVSTSNTVPTTSLDKTV